MKSNLMGEIHITRTTNNREEVEIEEMVIEEMVSKEVALFIRRKTNTIKKMTIRKEVPDRELTLLALLNPTKKSLQAEFTTKSLPPCPRHSKR